MGSGNNNRKNSDTTIVRRPKAFSSLGLSSGSGGGSNTDVCIPSFEVLIKDTNLTQVGVKVYLKKEIDVFSITIAGSIIGHLPNKYSKIITQCLEMGVKYSGEIILSKTKKYARFIRLL
jgi:hypothetical protein